MRLVKPPARFPTRCALLLQDGCGSTHNTSVASENSTGRTHRRSLLDWQLVTTPLLISSKWDNIQSQSASSRGAEDYREQGNAAKATKATADPGESNVTVDAHRMIFAGSRPITATRIDKVLTCRGVVLLASTHRLLMFFLYLLQPRFFSVSVSHYSELPCGVQ